jgi:hypothetical protein
VTLPGSPAAIVEGRLVSETTLLEHALDRLSPKDRAFAESLIGQGRKAGLTDKQLLWARRLIRKPPQRPRAADQLSASSSR